MKTATISPHKIWIIILVLILVVFTNYSAFSQWSQVNGPEGGSITDLLLDGSDLFAVTQNGGVYKSGDGAANWSLVGDDIVGDDANSIVKSGSNIVVGSSQGVYLTGNGGTSWSFPVTSPSSISQLILDGTDILAATDVGVYKSIDNGATWSGLGTLDLDYEISSIAGSGSVLWAVSSQDSNEGLYKSVNGGTNWTEVTNVGFTSTGFNFLYVSGSNTIVQNDSGEGIKYSDDGGTTWNVVTGIPDLITGIRELGGDLYAGTLGQSVYQSTDGLGGTDWAPFFSIGPVTSVVFDGVSNYYTGSSAGVYKNSTGDPDESSSWVPMFNGMKAHSVSALLTDGSDIYAGTTGGVHKSTDGGSSWSAVNNGIEGKDFYIQSLLKNGSDIYAGTLGGVIKTSDGGATWTQKNNGLSITLGVSSMVSAGSNIFAIELLLGIYRSSDGGDNWTSAIGTGYSGFPFSIGSDGTNIYSSGFFGEVLMISSDAGDNWTASSSGITNSGLNFASQFFYDGSSMYASTAEGMFRSDNNGTSWSAAGTGLPADAATSFAVDGSDLYAGFDGDGVYVTSSQGAGWTAVNTDLGNQRIASLAAGSLYAGSTGSSVWTFTPPPLGPPDQPAEVTFSSPTATSVTVDWIPPYINGSAITGYTLEQKEDGGSYSEVYSGTNTFYDATTLTTGTTYIFRVKATNAEGDSPFSDETDFTPQVIILMADGSTAACGGLFTDSGGPESDYQDDEDLVFTISPESPGDKVEVTFNSVDIEDGWDYLYVYDGPDTGSPPLETITGNSFSGTITSTATNGELTFNFDSDGSSTVPGWEATINCVSSGASVPDQPDAPTFGTVTSSSIVVNWTAPNDNGSTITGYRLQQKVGSGTFGTVYIGNDLTHTRTILSPGTEFFFRVQAINGEGDSPYSNEASETTSATEPDKPDAPTFGATTEYSIVVNWSAPDDNGEVITSYTLEQKEGSGGTYSEIFSGNSLSHTATGLDSDTEYFYKVKATNSVGDSPFSDEASETTSIAMPYLTYSKNPDISQANFLQGFTGTSFPHAIDFSNDGLKMFIVDGNGGGLVYEYALGSPYDVTSATFTTSVVAGIRGLAFNTDGTKMFVMDADNVKEYNLSVPFDLTTAVFNTDFSYSNEETLGQGLAFNNSGTKMYVLGDNVNEYTLSSAFDLSSASFNTSFSLSSNDNEPTDLEFCADGSKMFVLGDTGDKVYEFDLGTPFQISTSVFSQSFSLSSNDVLGLAIHPAGTRMYILGLGSAGYVYDLNSNAYSETISMDGSVEGSIIVSITNDTFTNAGGTLTFPGQFSISNLPGGLVPTIEVDNEGLTAELTLTGNATTLDDIADLQFEFTDAAFTNSNAADVGDATGPANSNLGIDFSARPPEKPSAPTFGAVSSSSIVLNWVAPDDNGTAISSYSLEQKEGTGGTFLEIFSGNALTHTAQGLNAETEYYFRIKAINEGGDSPFSDESSTTTTAPASAPDAPVSPTFGGITISAIVVNWIEPNDNGSTITNYSLEQKEGSGGTFSEVFSGNSLTHTATGLNAGTQYFFRVKATNSGGDSPFSSEASATTESFGAPDTPIPTYSEITATSVRVTFTGPANNCGDCAMTYAVDTALPGSDVIVSPYLATGDFNTGETISLVIGGLSPGTEYRFVVAIFNENGNTGSGVSTVTTLANSNPSISAQTFTIDENTNVDELVGDMEASDPDGHSLTYSITGGNTNDAFKILNTDDLFVNNRSALDYETNPVFTLTIQVDDGNGGTSTGTITINLNDVADTPVITNQSFSIDENSPVGTIVGSVSASHPNSSPLTFSIDGGNTNNAFIINVSTGQLSVNNSAELDFETTSQFALTISASDGFASEEATITINLNDIGGSQTITFDPISDKTEGDGVFTISATASSGFAVDFIVASGPATISGNEVTLTGAGTVTIKASQPGDSEYSPATDVEQSFCANPVKPVISVNGLGTGTVTLQTDQTSYPHRWHIDNIEMFEGVLQGNMITIEEAGVYSVESEVTGCISERSDDLSLVITDIQETPGEKISAYPNPVENTLNIQMEQRGSQQVEIALHDLNGKYLLTPTSKDINGYLSLDVSELKSGFYILRLQTEKGISQIKFSKK